MICHLRLLLILTRGYGQLKPLYLWLCSWIYNTRVYTYLTSVEERAPTYKIVSFTAYKNAIYQESLQSVPLVFLALSYILTYKQNDSFSLIEMWRIHFFSHSSLPYLNGCVVVTMPPFWNWIGKRRHLCPVLLTSAHNSTKGSFQIYSFVSKIFENVYSVLDLDISTVQFCVT